MLSSSLNKSKACNFADHFINVAKEIKNFFDRSELVDVVLVAGVDNVKAGTHRIILSASSGFFKAMFDSDLKEANSEEIVLGMIDGVTLNLLLNFFYTGTIELHSDTVECILEAADFFQINALVDACCDFMADELDTCNCLGISLFAEQHNYTSLYKKARKFAYEYFEKVCAEKEFSQLSKDQLTKFIFGTGFGLTSMKLVLQSLVAWIEHDKPNREAFVCTLLSHVRFNCLDPKFIIEATKPISKSPGCFEMVYNWLEWHLSPESRSNFTTVGAETKAKNKLIYATGDSDFQVQTYDTNLGKWSYGEWAHPLNDRVDYGMIVVNDKPIIVGGRIGEHVTNTIECLDLQTMKWAESPPMEEARCLPGLAELNGHLYVVGGEINGSWLQSVEVFDFDLRAWVYSQPLLDSISDVQVAVLNGLLYAVGIDMINLECYNPVTSEWSKTAPKDNKSKNFGITAVGNYLYVAGTHSEDIVTIERYDPTSDTWIEAKLFEFQCSFLRCASLNNKLIVFRGFDDGGEWITVVEEYNPETDNWIALAPLLPHDVTFSSRLLSMQSKD